MNYSEWLHFISRLFLCSWNILFSTIQTLNDHLVNTNCQVVKSCAREKYLMRWYGDSVPRIDAISPYSVFLKYRLINYNVVCNGMSQVRAMLFNSALLIKTSINQNPSLEHWLKIVTRRRDLSGDTITSFSEPWFRWLLIIRYWTAFIGTLSASHWSAQKCVSSIETNFSPFYTTTWNVSRYFLFDSLTLSNFLCSCDSLPQLREPFYTGPQ